MSPPLSLSDEMQRKRIIGAKEAAAFLNYSLPHFRRLYRTGKIPQPIKITDRKLGWQMGALIDFVASAPHREAA